MSGKKELQPVRRSGIQKIVVAGGGVLGSQIAYQAAYCGFDVTIWLRSSGSIGRTQPKLDALREAYRSAIEKMAAPGGSPADWCRGLADPGDFNKDDCLARAEAAYSGLKLELDMKKAFDGADIIIEAMTENVEQKTEFYKKAAPFIPKNAILATNSSTLLPSQFAGSTGCPERYLAIHFANEIWKNNTAEVMAQPATRPEIFDRALQFAADIRMVPLPVRKEKSGYLLNSMLVPFLFSALDLLVGGVSDPENIDKAWTLGTGAPAGPFRILDVVGLKTAYEIVSMYAAAPSEAAVFDYKGMQALLKKYIDAGKLGRSAGEGFYKY